MILFFLLIGKRTSRFFSVVKHFDVERKIKDNSRFTKYEIYLIF